MRLVNVSKEKCTIHKGTVVANLESVDDIHYEQVCTTNTLNQQNSQRDISKLPSHLEELYIRCCNELTTDQKLVYKQLLIKYQDVFSKDSDDLGYTNAMEFSIDTGNNKPVTTAPYRIPLSKRKDAEIEIERLAKAGIIEPANSPWLSPVVLVPKQNGQIRLCIDFRKVNKAIVNGDAQPLPRCDDLIDQLAGNSWFSTIDCKNAFHQVSIKESDRPKTAFAIPGFPQMQYTRMPFGLKTSPAAYERLMEKVLMGLSYVICLIYLDDCLSPSPTFETQVQILRENFD